MCALCWSAGIALANERDASGYAISRANTPVVIDGRLDDAAWESALQIDRFVPVGRDVSLARPGTRARLTFDGQALLVSFRCEEPDPGQIKANVTEHDGRVWLEDCVELFLDVTGSGNSYAHLAVNAKGVIYDAWRQTGLPADIGWNSEAEAAAIRDASGWSIEIRLPFDRLPAGWASSTWRIQLGRTRTTAPRHLTMLSTPLTGFHVPNQFEPLHGMEALEKTWSVHSTTLGDRLPGRNVARVILENLTPEARESTLSLWIGQQRIAHRAVIFQPKSVQTCELPYSLAAESRERIRLTAQSTSGPLGSLDQPSLSTDILGLKNNQVLMVHPHKDVSLAIPVTLAKDSLANAELQWKLIDPQGQLRQHGVVAVTQSKATIALQQADFGRHELRLVLQWDRQFKMERSFAIYLIPSPFAP